MLADAETARAPAGPGNHLAGVDLSREQAAPLDQLPDAAGTQAAGGELSLTAE